MNEKTMTLRDVTKENGLLTDGDWVESKDQDSNGAISLIQLADIKDGYFQRKSDRYLNERTAKRLDCTFLEEGDVLVARLPDPLGRACIYPGEKRKAVTAVDVCIVRIDKTRYNNRWLTHLINNPYFRKEINRFQSGTTRKRISKKNLAAIPFTVPEKKIQDDIADCIETQFTRLDAAIKSLKAIKAKLELYRKSVLKAVFSEKNDWIKRRLGDISEVTSSKRIFRHDYVDSGIPFYRTKEVVELSKKRDITTELFISNNKYAEIKDKFSAPRKNEILLSAVGTIGISWVIDDDRKFYFKDGNLLWIKQLNSIDPYFLKYYLDFLFIKGIKNITSGTAYRALTIEKLKEFRIYCPARISEQQEIVQKIEVWFSLIDKVGVVIDASLAKSEKLRKSILKTAFEGKLVN